MLFNFLVGLTIVATSSLYTSMNDHVQYIKVDKVKIVYEVPYAIGKS